MTRKHLTRTPRTSQFQLHQPNTPTSKFFDQLCSTRQCDCGIPYVRAPNPTSTPTTPRFPSARPFCSSNRGEQLVNRSALRSISDWRSKERRYRWRERNLSIGEDMTVRNQSKIWMAGYVQTWITATADRTDHWPLEEIERNSQSGFENITMSTW